MASGGSAGEIGRTPDDGTAARAGTVAHGWKTSSSGASPREPGLDAAFRPGPGEFAGRFWTCRHGAQSSRIARLAGERVHGKRLELETSAPPHRDLGHVSAVLA